MQSLLKVIALTILIGHWDVTARSPMSKMRHHLQVATEDTGFNMTIPGRNVEVRKTEAIEDSQVDNQDVDEDGSGFPADMEEEDFGIMSGIDSADVGFMQKWSLDLALDATKQYRQCTCGQENVKRIFGGEEAQPNQYPWQAALISDDDSLCVGVIINQKFILTAAHCTRGKSVNDITVKVGVNNWRNGIGAQIPRVAKIIEHPEYYSDKGRNFNDISLVELYDGIVFDQENKVAPICLPSDPSNEYLHVKAIVSGWGQTHESVGVVFDLQHATVLTMPNNACKQVYFSWLITEKMLCAGFINGGATTCEGDSGGPLVYRNGGKMELIGIVSFGSEFCGEAPSVFTRVTKYLDWINWHTERGVTCSPPAK